MSVKEKRDHRTYRLCLIITTIILLLLAGYIQTIKSKHELEARKMFHFALNMKTTQIKNLAEVLESQLISYYIKIDDIIFKQMTIVEHQIDSYVQIDEDLTAEDVSEFIQSLSPKYPNLEFTAWNQEENRLDIAYLDGQEIYVTKDLDKYLIESGVYQMYYVEKTNQIVIIKLKKSKHNELITEAISNNVKLLQQFETRFSMIQLSEDYATTDYYFGQLITGEESSEDQYLFLYSMSDKKREFIEDLREHLVEKGEYTKTIKINGDEGEGEYLIYARLCSEMPLVILTTTSMSQLMGGSIEMVQDYDQWIGLQLAIALGIVSVIIVVAFVSGGLLIRYYKSKEIKVEQQRVQMIGEHNEIILSKYERINEIAHDIKNHLISIKGLINSSPEHPAIQYIDSVYHDLDELSQTVITGNHLFDVVLNEKILKMKKENVTFKRQFETASLEFIEDKDLVIILTNLLDNAIESSMKSEKKSIEFSLYTLNGSYVVLKVINSCDEPPLVRKGQLITQKDNQEIHGYGVKNIQRVVKRYNGMTMWEYSEIDKQFKFLITIPISS